LTRERRARPTGAWWRHAPRRRLPHCWLERVRSVSRETGDWLRNEAFLARCTV